MLGNYIRITIDSEAASVRDDGLRILTGNAEPTRKNDGRGRVYVVCDTALRGIVKLRVAAVIHQGQHQTFVAAPDGVTPYEPVLRELLAEHISGSYKLVCLYEKSCGAIVFRRRSGNIEYLLIKNKKGGNWGFPKGHIEQGEQEHDTAIREVREETGLVITPLDGFRAISEYHPRGKIYKEVVFFIAEMPEDGCITVQQSEVDRFIWADYSLAMRTFRFNNDRNILTMAKNWLTS